MTKETSNKIANLGIVCAFLVVFIHTPRGQNPTWGTELVYGLFSHGIGKIAVPFFFAASGYLLAGHFDKNGWYVTALTKRLRTLVLPLIIWCAFYFLWREVVMPTLTNAIAHRPLFANIANGFCWRTFASILAMHPTIPAYLGILWFIRTLFALVVLSPMLKWSIHKVGWVAILALWLMHGAFHPDYGVPRDIWFHIFQEGFISLFGLAYFGCGMILRMRGYNLAVPLKAGIIALVAGVILLLWRGMPYQSLFGRQLTWLYTPLLIVGIWTICPSKRWPEFLITASFPVYVLHMFVFHASRLLLKGTFANMTASRYVLLGLGSFAICVALSYLIRRFLPRFSAIVFGGR